ncbi:hypothetical protein [Plastoroseomonas arctica]|uniref:Uncharacterized protein n=1 Tax=Plastoroseomonas arctica TaxID=1509237 RepID=A0AAF1K076_9PROT|nr:hypothetical protein [Plastoroseomonas arctica]MBR0656513.1 hypothetical protein [Plastoroseomonas arctica]
MRWLHTGSGIAATTAGLLIATIAVGSLHHIDHVLRVDHSGWPFRPDVNPFTYSLVAYPVLLFALLGPARYFWLRWVGLAVGTGFTLYAHTLIETPQMQYAMWAYNQSLEPELRDIRNLCGVQSTALGWAAMIVAMALNVLLVVSAVAMLIDGLKRAPAD